DLCACTIERPDERQSEHAIPELDDGRGQLRDLALLTHDHFFTALLIGLHRDEAELIDELRDLPQTLSTTAAVALRHDTEQWTLEREYEERRLRGREALDRPRLGDVAEMGL